MNSLERQTAFEACDIRHTCLLEWHKAARKVAAEKGKAVPIPERCGSYAK